MSNKEQYLIIEYKDTPNNLQINLVVRLKNAYMHLYSQVLYANKKNKKKLKGVGFKKIIKSDINCYDCGRLLLTVDQFNDLKHIETIPKNKTTFEHYFKKLKRIQDAK